MVTVAPFYYQLRGHSLPVPPVQADLDRGSGPAEEDGVHIGVNTLRGFLHGFRRPLGGFSCRSMILFEANFCTWCEL